MQLKDERVRGLIASRLNRLGFGHAGDVKPVGQGISELRIHYGPGYRIYFPNEATRLSFCCAAAIRARKQKTSRRQSAGYIAHALGVVARAKGMAQIAGQTGLSREQLYRSFSENGNPTLKTTLAVMRALGLDLTAKVHA